MQTPMVPTTLAVASPFPMTPRSNPVGPQCNPKTKMQTIRGEVELIKKKKKGEEKLPIWHALCVHAAEV